jgi:dTDP-4-amino-4,6-dideoxygalactose transaminase
MKAMDLQRAHDELGGELHATVARVIASGQFVLGPEVEAFEADFAAYCGVRHAVGVGNGLDALRLLLQAMDIGPGDEVIVPAHTFIATWLAATHAGATPVPVDVDGAGFAIDPARVEAAIGPRTRAIVAVHLYGLLAPMAELRAIADRHGLRLLEDAAQAHGARLDGRRAGSLGDGAAFSFYPAKNLGALGDAGAVVTDDDDIANRVRQLRNYGSTRKYEHLVAGGNSRLDPLHAAVLGLKLARLDDWNARRRAIADRYRSGLGDGPLGLPAAAAGSEPVWHQFVVRSPRRDALQAHLREAGIESLVHYPRAPHRQPAYAALGLGEGSFPVAERLSREVLSLPMHPHLHPDEVDAVVAACRSFGD